MTGRPEVVLDNTDWLKAIAIILAAIDHTGYFFIEDAGWWSVFGRLAAPVFFFLMGYARTRRVPLVWIVLGLILSLLESWNAGWTWVSPNILLSLALIRLIRPYVESLARSYGWMALFTLIAGLIVLLPVSGNIADYGAEGWLWALFGLYQRLYVDDGAPGVKWADLMRLLAGLAAAAAYVWQEQAEYLFTQPQFNIFMFGICGLSICLGLFRRGPSPVQPPQIFARSVGFLGRHTLAIYGLQLGLFEIVIGLMPDWSA